MATMNTARRPPAASDLTLHLFTPGMSPIHRAGLGGLACTLRHVERRYAKGQLPDAEVPGAPWGDGKAPWSISETSIRLDWNAPENAGDFLSRLFRLAFGLGTDGLVSLPGQYQEEGTSASVRAELQAGLLLTFLQHGKTRKLATDPVTLSYDPEGSGSATVVAEYRRCSWYKHQEGWRDLVDGSGRFVCKAVEVAGPLNPGAVVRHNAYAADTKIEDPPERLLPLYFALVGCIALAVNRGVGVLVVPEVTDLVSFAKVRPWMTPTSAKECRISSAGDAALQAQVRLWSKQQMAANDVPACYAMTFRPTVWATQQKTRVSTIHVPPGDDRRLEQFDVALHELAPRVVARGPAGAAGRGKARGGDKGPQGFWADSVARPLVADNLALGRLWYAGFARLMHARDAGGTALRDRLSFERKGIFAMTQKLPAWGDEAAAVLVRAVHQAIRSSLGRIRQETDGDRPLSQATKNRWDRFKERLRLSLVGAKTPDQCRAALCTLFGRAGANTELQAGWQAVLPLLSDDGWQRARDLSLLALASYAGRDDGSAPEASVQLPEEQTARRRTS